VARNGAVVYGHWRSTAYVWCEIRVVVAVDSVSRGYPERVESDADVRAFLGVGDALLVQFETYVLEEVPDEDPYDPRSSGDF